MTLREWLDEQERVAHIAQAEAQHYSRVGDIHSAYDCQRRAVALRLQVLEAVSPDPVVEDRLAALNYELAWAKNDLRERGKCV